MFAKSLATIAAPDFDLALTLDSGQVFHWEKKGAGFVGAIGERALYVEQRGEMLAVTRGSEALARSYFALDHPLAEIRATFPDDDAMRAAREFCRGLRIIRQPLWECLATFITSSMKQVAHIRQMSHAIRRKFGKPIDFDGATLFSYPAPEVLARARVEKLLAC